MADDGLTKVEREAATLFARHAEILDRMVIRCRSFGMPGWADELDRLVESARMFERRIRDMGKRKAVDHQRLPCGCPLESGCTGEHAL